MVKRSKATEPKNRQLEYEDYSVNDIVRVKIDTDKWVYGTVRLKLDSRKIIYLECIEEVSSGGNLYDGYGFVVSDFNKIVKIPTPYSFYVFLANIFRFVAKHSNGFVHQVVKETPKDEFNLVKLRNCLVLNAGEVDLNDDSNNIGRDLEMYMHLGNNVFGWEKTLTVLLDEIILPIKDYIGEGYNLVRKELKEFGRLVYRPDIVECWEAII